jgi:hypothetical protein
MQHVETFDCKISSAEFEVFVREELLPYWRGKGLQVWVFRFEAALGPSQYALVTGMENFASIDSWPAKSTGDQQGRELMVRYQSYVQNLRAVVLKDIEA